MEELRATSNPAFRFIVEIDEVPVAAFTECTLPVIEWEMKDVKEGGVNSHIRLLPGRRKIAKLTLKNGVGLAKSLIDWYLASMNEQFELKKIVVHLLSAPDKNAKTMTWTINDCIPVKWTGPQLKSSDNTIAIQTLEVACGKIECEVPKKVAESTGWKPIPYKVPKGKGRVKNASNDKLIPPHVVPPSKKRVLAKKG